MAKDIKGLSKRLYSVLRELLDVVNEHEARLDTLERKPTPPVVSISDERARPKEWEENDFIKLKTIQLKIVVYLLRNQDSFDTGQIAAALSLPKNQVSWAINGLAQKQKPHPRKKLIYEEITERVHDHQYRFIPGMRSKYGELIEGVWSEYGDNSLGTIGSRR